jgi:hypothetical protein
VKGIDAISGGDDDMRKKGFAGEMSPYPKILIFLHLKESIRKSKRVKRMPHTKLSSRVHTRLAHSFTGIDGSPGAARSTSRPSHQHLR